MKVRFRESIKAQVDAEIERYGAAAIKEIVLTRDEYIQFLEEIPPVGRIILTLPERTYLDVHLAIVP